MNNLSEDVNKSTPTPSFTYTDCLQGLHFGFIFSYCVMTFCFFLGTPANAWCIWVYVCIEQKVKQTHVFLLNYTIMGLIFCLNCAAEMVNLFLFKDKMYYKVIYFFLCLSWIGRPLLQTCICIEQYLAVIYPVRFLKYKSIKYRIAASVGVWFMSIGYALYQLTILAFPDAIINSVFIIALAVILFCCASVMRALKHPGPGDAHTRNQTGRDIGNQQKRNAFNTIFTALLLILFSYLPQASFTISSFLKIDQMLFECNVAPFTISFNVLGVMVTPLIKMYKEGYLKRAK